ncbi:MAG: hypothetical protein QF441_09725 [Bacteriovoracaceae bacterium]|nr:hypothetical protein [Bacteriovoracaceae bacterium]
MSGGPTRIRDEHPYYTDIIEYSIIPHKISPAFIAKLYLGDGLSSSQIASKLGLSKTAVLERLRSLGIRKGDKKSNPSNKENYQNPHAPFGYKKIDNKIVPNQTEIKICRMIVTAINDEKMSYRATAKLLVSKKIKNRKGEISWGHSVIKSIYERWNGKL